jgi:hypothetical protein
VQKQKGAAPARALQRQMAYRGGLAGLELAPLVAFPDGAVVLELLFPGLLELFPGELAPGGVVCWPEEWAPEEC